MAALELALVLAMDSFLLVKGYYSLGYQLKGKRHLVRGCSSFLTGFC